MAKRSKKKKALSSETSAKVAGTDTFASPPSSWIPQDWLLGLFLVLAVILTYLPVWYAGFIWDDDAHVTRLDLRSWAGLGRIWFVLGATHQYYPLVHSIFWVEHWLWGDGPLGYHLVNILLHALSALLLVKILRRLEVPGAWLAAAIFALHPVQVETVAWITELKNLESLFFYLLALLAWMNFVDEPDRSWWHCYGLALAAYLLSLFAKTTACTLPAAMLLVLWLQGQRLTWSRCIQILPFLLAGLGMGLVSVWWKKHLGNYDDRFGLPLSVLQRMLIAGRALWFYAGKLAWPVDLTFSYPHWDINPGALLQYVPLAGCIAVAAIL